MGLSGSRTGTERWNPITRLSLSSRRTDAGTVCGQAVSGSGSPGGPPPAGRQPCVRAAAAAARPSSVARTPIYRFELKLQGARSCWATGVSLTLLAVVSDAPSLFSSSRISTPLKCLLRQWHSMCQSLTSSRSLHIVQEWTRVRCLSGRPSLGSGVRDYMEV